MTIGIDARLYGTRHGGIGRYIKELILNLLKIDCENQYVLFVYSNKDKQEISSDCRDVACNISTRLRFIQAPYRWYSLKEQLLMSGLIKKVKVDLMHFPHFNVPLIYHQPYVLTIHDLIIHHFPDERATTLPRWLYKIKLQGYKWVMSQAIKKARVIITPSEFTKKDILRFYDVSQDKVRVVYEGVDIKSKCQMTNVKSMSNDKCQMVRDCLLYVGSAYPHKNLEKLIEAFVILRQKYNLTNLKLFFVGKSDYFYQKLQKYIKDNFPRQFSGQAISQSCLLPACRQGRADRFPNFYFYGHATDSDLTELYQNAKLFVFPSLYEGFGLPPLEAMSFGLPVITSSASSIPEICGNAVLYFNPYSVEDIAFKIYQAYNDKILQEKLRQKGLEQIKKYAWSKMARETLEIYSACKTNLLAP